MSSFDFSLNPPGPPSCAALAAFWLWHLLVPVFCMIPVVAST
jgi:hypothetical protein